MQKGMDTTMLRRCTGLPVTPITYSLIVITPYLVGITHKTVGNWGHRVWGLGFRVLSPRLWV